MMSAHLPRRSALAGLLAALGLAARTTGAAAQSQPRPGADPVAEQFVQTEGQKMLTVLTDRRLSKAEKEATFRKVLDQVADFQRITGFVLGKYARTITPAQRQQFNAAFRTYAQGLYQSHLADFKGDKLRVTGSVQRAPGDSIVNSVVNGGGPNGAPLPVAWRVLTSSGSPKVVDVQAKGVWLAITLQQDFVSTIDNARGDINVLIARLQRDNQRQGART